MKKISIFIVSLALFTGISFASSLQAKQDTKAKTDKKTPKKTDKKEVKKVPVRKTVITKPTSTNGTAKQ